MPRADTSPGPLAPDLDVMKTGGVADPVTREDVERALYALTGWQKPQDLVDTMMDVVDKFAFGVKARLVEREPVRLPPGHHGPVGVPGSAAVEPTSCEREHLEDHVCVSAVVESFTPFTPPLASVARADVRALAEASETVETAAAKRVREPSFRNMPAMTPRELLDAPDVNLLTPAQLNARHVLLLARQTCSSCEEEKDLADFYRDKARLTGHASRCKKCANEASVARRQEKGGKAWR